MQNIFRILDKNWTNNVYASFRSLAHARICRISWHEFFYTRGFICIGRDFSIFIRRSWYKIKHIKSCRVLIGSPAAHRIGLRTRTSPEAFGEARRRASTTVTDPLNRMLSILGKDKRNRILKMTILAVKFLRQVHSCFPTVKAGNYFAASAWAPSTSSQPRGDVNLVEGIPKTPVCYLSSGCRRGM